jgi:hypothetical protein
MNLVQSWLGPYLHPSARANIGCMLPRVIVFGPSGVGKSTVPQELTRQNWLHFESDVPSGRDGVTEAGLRSEWDGLYCRQQPDQFSAALETRAKAADRLGAVVSLPSLILFASSVLASCQQTGLTPVILFGSRDDCLRAFVDRECRTGRNLSVAHWDANNLQQSAFGSQEYAAFRIEAFRDHAHRPLRELIDEIVNPAMRIKT